MKLPVMWRTPKCISQSSALYIQVDAAEIGASVGSCCYGCVIRDEKYTVDSKRGKESSTNSDSTGAR
jgi:hypothetical protein